MTTTTVSFNQIFDSDGDSGYQNSDEIIIISTSTTTLSTTTTISTDYKHPTRSTLTTTTTTTTPTISPYYDIDGDHDYFDTDGDYITMNEYDVFGYTPHKAKHIT